MKKILVINGANLNLLGVREPQIYGSTTLQQINAMCINLATSLGVAIECFQSNSEYEIITKIHNAKNFFTHIIINAGAFSHTSLAIVDALKAVNIPVYEVHLSNIYARETYRQFSYISTIAQATVGGLNQYGYLYLISHIANN